MLTDTTYLQFPESLFYMLANTVNRGSHVNNSHALVHIY